MAAVILKKGDRYVYGATLADAVALAGARLEGRQLVIDGHRYHSYTENWTDAEMAREAVKDSKHVLTTSHGWTLFREADWRG